MFGVSALVLVCHFMCLTMRFDTANNKCMTPLPNSLDPATMKYEPFGRDYIKQGLYLHLKELAGR